MPAEVAETEVWWEWVVSNWGTKWDAQQVVVVDGGEVVEYEFETAWSPPVPWLRTVAKMYPELRFRLTYDEPGMELYGAMTLEDGVLVRD